MKKSLFVLMTVLLGLFAGVGTIWADDAAATIYLASLKAQKSEASTGDGQVKLTWLDITGRPMAATIAKQINYLAFNNPSYMGMDYIYNGPDETAQLAGGTLIAIDGMEEAVEMGPGSQIYTTSFLYFHAETEAANGSYLAEWRIVGDDNQYVTRMTSSMDPADPMGKIVYTEEWSEEAQAWVEVIDSANSILPLRTPCFKVLPDKANSTSYSQSNPDIPALTALAQAVAANPNMIYAVFNKYLLNNPVITSASMDAVENAQAHLTVTIEIDGSADSLDIADFAGIEFSNNDANEWTYDLEVALEAKEVVSEQKTKIVIPVTYTYKNTGVGTKNTTMTISMAGDNPSVLNVNLSVVALDPSRPEAYWFDGKTEQTSGNLSDMLAVDISGYSNPILKLNKPVATNLPFSEKDFTLDLNGNTTQAITVSSGNVTIAYSSFGGTATSLTVNGGKAILNGGTFGSLTIGASGTVEQNGATITGTATNHGILTTTDGIFQSGLTSDKTLTLNGGTFNGDTAVIISGGTAAINRGIIEGTEIGLKVTGGGTATTKKLAAIKGGTYSAQRTGGTLIVECGKFDGPLNGSVDFTSGYFKTNNYGVSTEGKNEMLVSAGVEYNEGYRYFLGTAESAVANGAGVCRIGNVSYAKLEDAIAYANNNPSVQNIVIFMTNNYTLPAGYYTLPANATIVVPMSDSQEKEINLTAPRIVFNDFKLETPYASIQTTEFRRLTFASGVNMEVFGQIELTCSQYASNEAYTSQPVGSYGHLVMEEGSHMTLQDHSELRAWGFMTGKGETDARRGSKVREMFQLGDWKGAMTSVAITGLVTSENPTLCNVVKSQGGDLDNCDYSDKKIFPVTQYFIQNIESPVKYHPGAVLSTSAAVSEGLLGMSVSMAATDIAIVGVNGVDKAIFLMDQMADADNTWVRKWYDSENDIQVYDINSAAHIGSMVLDMGDINLLTYGSVPIRLNSANFDLPLTCNFKIHLLSGTMDFQQNTCLLPGAEVEVDKEAMVTVAKDELDPDHTGALYVYDADEWDKYAYCNEYDGLNFVKDKAYTKVVRYAPSWNGRPNVRNEQAKPADAAINVRGTFMTATGFVYTSESGANIFSNNEDAGTFIFNDDAVNAGTRTVYNVKGVKTYESRTFYPARLKHGDGTYENTDEAVADLAYCYQNDKWSTMIQDECFMKENRGGNDVYYAKPQEYVALANGKTANADHTYSDAAGAGRLFILIQNGYNCQWWEVENVDNLYHCTHPQNDTYYYWDEDEETWKEKTYTITWKNWDGSIIQTIGPSETLEDEYIVTYGTMAEFLGPNPTRENNIDSTYSFIGWKPALGPVTQDVTYTATYESQPRMYTIIFNNEGGTEIERQFLKHNAVPVCENTPTKVGHILQWDPAISPVIGDQTYTATWLEKLPSEWDVTFVNNAGGELQAAEAVGVSEHPVYRGSTPPTKENADHLEYSSNEYTYTFWGWSAVIDGVAQRFAAGTELPCPTHATTYTAVYTEAQKTYTVTFKNGEDKLFEKTDYHYGDTPECPADKIPADESDAQYTYAYAWSPQIQTVMGNQTYQWTSTSRTTNKYTVTLTSNLSGVCTFTGAGTYDYGTEITNVTVSYNDSKYTFDGWSDLAAEDEDKKNSTHPSFTLTGDVTLTANFTPIALADHTVGTNDTWTVDEDTEVKDLIITSDGSACGQLLNPENLTIRGEAIYRIQQTFAAGTWYAVAVPWRVNPATGIYGASSRLASGSQIYVIEFDGAAYANTGVTDDTYQYWHFLNETGGDMVPGKLYMIWLASGQSRLDFHKKAGAALQTRNLTVSTASGSVGESFNNWNAISNPALYTADLSTGVTKYQTYDNNDDETYTLVDAATEDLIVAKPIFVQVTTPGTVYATVSSGSAPAPYRTAPQVENESKFVVEISRNNKMADRLIIETADEKADEYVIGQDLAKFGVSSKVAQMWINRYDAKLCVNVVEMENERAEYPLSIFAPADGEYTLSAAQRRGEMALYLTYNGEAIANLSESAYTLTLNRGTAFGYGLRISPKMPQVTTGVDELIINSKDATATKVLINNKVYIIRGEKVYTVDGQLVK
ncbi:MAG: hypothetical protein IJV61_05135 [Paludibacteraceae bacterium]|nr:hypothetical protein [Paludibacteraceae bacterium]